MNKNKKTLSLLLCFCCAFLFSAVSPVVAQVADFPDVPVDTTHYGAVKYLKEKSVIGGYPDGTFKPGNDINRAEALKIVLLASGFTPGEQGTENFPDVNPEDWFSPYVAKGVSSNIVKGYDDGTFKPATNINVAESLKIILLAFGINAGDPPQSGPYPDVDSMSWYSTFASYAKTKQFIWTMDDGKLHAERNITRGEFVQIIYRLMYTKENNLEEFPISLDWPKYIDPFHDYTLKIPFGWEKINANDQLILWKQDKENNQLSWVRSYPNSATVVIAVDDNKNNLNLDQYLTTIEYDSSAVVQKLVLNTYPFASVNISAVGINDYYFELPNKSILVAYSQIGTGLNRDQLLEEIRHLVGSIRYEAGVSNTVATPSGSSGGEVAVASEKDVFLSEVRKKILEDGQSEEIINSFPGGLIVIDTDTIGIGTGPVDYYYSSNFDVSLKVDRNSDTLLALSDGRGSAF